MNKKQEAAKRYARIRSGEYRGNVKAGPSPRCHFCGGSATTTAVVLSVAEHRAVHSYGHVHV